jgi:hypothetical protein
MRIFLASEVRVVGLVARIAEHAAGVFGGDHLREGLRLGGVLFVAAAAEVGDIGELGDVGGGVIGMPGEGTVAGFAGDVGVLTGGASFGLVIVAHDALVLAGVRNGALAGFEQGGGAVVAVLAEGLGDDYGTYDEEDTKRGEKDNRGADEVSGIGEEAAQSYLLFWSVGGVQHKDQTGCGSGSGLYRGFCGDLQHCGLVVGWQVWGK